MTRNEAIKNIKEHCYFANLIPPAKEALDMAIKALEQEPCGDAVSRQAVLDINEHHHGQMPNHVNHEIWKEIKALPPVTPQPKMGHWKAFTHSAYRGNDEDGEPIWREVTVYHCDLCNRRTVIKEKYCPNCGHKMQEVPE